MTVTGHTWVVVSGVELLILGDDFAGVRECGECQYDWPAFHDTNADNTSKRCQRKPSFYNSYNSKS